MKTMDFKEEFKHLYNPPTGRVVIVDVPRLQFLMIGGAGDPNTSPDYQDAVRALYSVAYAAKFTLKATVSYSVPPLEGLWWADDMTQFSVTNKGLWKWTMMIMQPEDLTEKLFRGVLSQVARKKPLSALDRMRLESLHEGLSAQTMHIGPYAAEGPTMERLHGFIREGGYAFRGTHHEIYLSDPRRAAPEKMRTVLRQPVAT